MSAASASTGGDKAREIGVYLLTPTHVGTGQAVGAIDLPIAREVHTQWPLIPSTAMKGVARDSVEDGDRNSRTAISLFGPRPPQKSEGGSSLKPGALVFTDAQILAFPVASLSAPFYWVTSPMVIARWARARQAWGLNVPEELPTEACGTFSHHGSLVLADQVVNPGQWRPEHTSALKAVAQMWRSVLPGNDGVAAGLQNALVCVDDALFGLLVTAGTAVNARVQLTDGKTTDNFELEDGTQMKGNLWYEESLPPDCLFSAIIAMRPGHVLSAGSGTKPSMDSIVQTLGGEAGRQLQVGGNETVGQGITWWRVEAP